MVDEVAQPSAPEPEPVAAPEPEPVVEAEPAAVEADEPVADTVEGPEDPDSASAKMAAAEDDVALD